MRLLAEKVNLRTPTQKELKAAVGEKPRFFVDLLLALVDKRNGNKHRLKRTEVDAAIERLKDRQMIPGNLDHIVQVVAGTSSKIYVKDAEDFDELWLEGVYWTKKLTEEQVQKINAKYENGTLGASWEIGPYEIETATDIEDTLDIKNFEFSGFGIMVDIDPAEEATRGSVTIIASKLDASEQDGNTVPPNAELGIDEITKQLGDFRSEIMTEVHNVMDEKELQAKLDEQKKTLDAEFDAKLAKALEAKQKEVEDAEKLKHESIMQAKIDEAVNKAIEALKASLQVGASRIVEIGKYETIEADKQLDKMVELAEMDEKDYKIRLLELENDKLKASKGEVGSEKPKETIRAGQKKQDERALLRVFGGGGSI